MKIYQSILQSESAIELINHRNLLKAKILCVDPKWRKEIYVDCLASVDTALQSVFDSLYSLDNENRIPDLVEFWQEIDR